MSCEVVATASKASGSDSGGVWLAFKSVFTFEGARGSVPACNEA